MNRRRMLILPYFLGVVLIQAGLPSQARQAQPNPVPRATTGANTRATTATQAVKPARQGTPLSGPAKSPAIRRPAAPLSENQKIEALLRHIRDSGCIFIRNGQEYPATKAVDHLRGKWNYAGKRIKTARDFIDALASKSSISGKPYMVRLKDGKTIPSRQWLMQALGALESAPTNQPAASPKPTTPLKK